MKKKPDLKEFVQPSKDPTDFLNSGIADIAEREDSSSKATSSVRFADKKKPEPTVQKIFRLRWDVANALKLHVAEQSIALGFRVTETDIVNKLLCDFLKIDI